MKDLIKKYNTAAPRYTSYPTVPFWTNTPSQFQWEKIIQKTFSHSNLSEGISLYIHLPFCESLCTYCGCNTRITVNHQVELPYVTAVLSEWSMYLRLMDSPPRIKEIHLGGGTPTFFSPEHLKQLLTTILSSATLCSDPVLSFEGHPDNTRAEHLHTLREIGFTRISLGIQDFDPVVQQAIHRKQSVEQVEKITFLAREAGYNSINYDLIYGLPHQTAASIHTTIREVIQLRPDRIAFYSYAHVPWMKPGQRSFSEKDLPSAELKRELYEIGRSAFEKAGYIEIGMDHFALPDDELSIALKNGTLHRNFMGYSATKTELLIGLGVSSISDAWFGFVQNEKKLEDYYKRILHGELPFFKGHILNETDLILRKHILSIMCRLKTSWENSRDQFAELEQTKEKLREFELDGLIKLNAFDLVVTQKGKQFLRNICMAFDVRLAENQPTQPIFSQAV